MDAAGVLGNPMSARAEVRYAALRLWECLTDTLRIAESRGLRLPGPGGDTDEGVGEDAEEADGAPTLPAGAVG